jgi:hypothetical protein
MKYQDAREKMAKLRFGVSDEEWNRKASWVKEEWFETIDGMLVLFLTLAQLEAWKAGGELAVLDKNQELTEVEPIRKISRFEAFKILVRGDISKIRGKGK